MAKTIDNEAAVGIQQGEQPQAKNKAAENVYSAAELAGAARRRFKVPPEVVSAALKVADKERATFEEAHSIVKAFLERKVQ